MVFFLTEYKLLRQSIDLNKLCMACPEFRSYRHATVRDPKKITFAIYLKLKTENIKKHL